MADAPLIPIAGDDKAEHGAIASAPVEPPQTAGRLWQRGGGLSSFSATVGDHAERFLTEAGFDRAPWLAALFAGGILTWFALRTPWQWASAIGLCLLLALFALAAWRDRDDRDRLRRAMIAASLVFAAGMAVIWVRSEVVGAQAIERPMIERVQG